MPTRCRSTPCQIHGLSFIMKYSTKWNLSQLLSLLIVLCEVIDGRQMTPRKGLRWPGICESGLHTAQRKEQNKDRGQATEGRHICRTYVTPAPHLWPYCNCSILCRCLRFLSRDGMLFSSALSKCADIYCVTNWLISITLWTGSSLLIDRIYQWK